MSNSTAAQTRTYIFETYTDRERLYVQYELMRDDFLRLFERALTLGGLDTNPETARWRVLDVGCGEGLYAAEIVRHYPHAHVVGYDKDAEAVLTANMMWGNTGDIQFYTHDALDPIPDVIAGDNYDIVFAWMVLMHTRDGKLALANAAAALKPGGVFIARDATSDWMEYPHPAMLSLTTVFNTAWQRFSSADFGNNHRQYIEGAGFTDFEEDRQRYMVGGTTDDGKRMFFHIVSTMEGVRNGVVNGLKLMDGATYDGYIAQLKTESTTAMVGHADLVTAIARKP